MDQGHVAHAVQYPQWEAHEKWAREAGVDGVRSGEAPQFSPQPYPTQPRPVSSSFRRQVARLLCSEPDEPPPRSRRNTASAPADANSRPETPAPSPRERQLSELRMIPILANHSERRRRARISSEYCSSSDAYTPLYPSPIEPANVPYYPTSERRSRSEILYSGARGALLQHGHAGFFVTGDEDPFMPRGHIDTADGSHYRDWLMADVREASGGRQRRRRKRQSRVRLTEISPTEQGIDAADTDETPAPALIDQVGSCSQETVTADEPGKELQEGGRRILRRNSTGTVQVMDMGSLRSGVSGERSGSC